MSGASPPSPTGTTTPAPHQCGLPVNPFITVSPTTAGKGAVVRVVGTGFCPDEKVKLFVDTDYYAGTAATDANGKFTEDMKVPLSTPSPTLSTFVRARGTVSDKPVMTSFTVG